MTVISATRIFIAISLFGVVLAAKPGEEGYCTPGESFQVDCNTCHCTPDGKNAMCTLKGCLPPGFPHSFQKRQTPKAGEEGYCTPGESFKQDCNTCHCTADGKNAYCTLIGCLSSGIPHALHKRQTPQHGEEGYCTPGTSWKNDCNTCRCTSDGRRAACTEIGCLSSTDLHSNHKRQTPKPGEDGYCTPGQSFQKECNTCHCSPDGKNAVCTLKGCLTSGISHSVQKRQNPQLGEEGYCIPGTSWKKDCNTCDCNPDGRSAACTKMGCISSVDHLFKRKRQTPQPGEEGYCTPGKSWKDDCNTCNCSPDGKHAACTLMACISSENLHHLRKRQSPAPNTPGFSCSPGQPFQHECNTCTCGSDGKTAACTFKLCNRKRRQAPAPNTPGFSCSPGQPFQHECNTCTCGSDGKTAACTFKLCNRKRRQAPAPNTPGFSCNAGESFKYECNNCRCGADGKTAACTYAACPPGSFRRKRQASECQNGETKKDDCNNCQCANGKWACTRKFCPKTKRAAECQDGEHKTQDCNSCNCIQGNWACTRQICPKVKRAAECQDGEHKTQDCNSCNCIQGNWACTRQICPKVKREAECQDGENKKEDCNSCKCVKGGWACTRQFCPKVKRETQCTDGTNKQEDCNNCKCVNGNWACTKRFCPKAKREEPVEKEFNGSSCAPNDKFPIDCNTCYCNSDGSGYSCTEKLCASATSAQT